jgi:hypothetical protein
MTKLAKDMETNPIGEPTHAPLRTQATVVGVKFEDLEEAASLAGTGVVGETLNKILTYMRKIELSIGEKADQTDM